MFDLSPVQMNSAAQRTSDQGKAARLTTHNHLIPSSVLQGALPPQHTRARARTHTHTHTHTQSRCATCETLY